MTEFFKENFDNIRIHFQSEEIKNLTYENVNDEITNKIKNKIGDKCNKNGFVFKDSIELIQRSKFEIPNEDLKVKYITNVYYKLKIVNPEIGQKIKSRVESQNSFGILCKPIDNELPFDIFIPNDTREKNSKISNNEEVEVEVIAKNFEEHDEKITIIAKIL